MVQRRHVPALAVAGRGRRRRGRQRETYVNKTENKRVPRRCQRLKVKKKKNVYRGRGLNLYHPFAGRKTVPRHKTTVILFNADAYDRSRKVPDAFRKTERVSYHRVKSSYCSYAFFELEGRVHHELFPRKRRRESVGPTPRMCSSLTRLRENIRSAALQDKQRGITSGNSLELPRNRHSPSILSRYNCYCVFR